MSLVSAKLKNPTAWAYMKMLHGKPVNPLHLVSMYNNYHEQEQMNLIENMCAASNQIAVASAQLTRRQREKYAARKFKHGRRVFYLFSRRAIPADIGSTIELEEGVRVYL
ncbi:hypothetical protein [Paenibacillus lactis]|uniref:Transposase n=1 Tax=Paenibacillus lactis TaxID=228574 RepID=A0ABS4FLA5_9BACL|nr:hypothetical protein [Paenibacillus lactis]MBP1897049.1 hypothetical protein [Paenibacillus lactis]HAS7789739.1 hypothetical protein [Vibrio cholerae]